MGALPFDVQKIQPDALICAAYKWLMGPYSSGVAYFGSVMDGGQPIEENWINRKNSHDFRNLINYHPDYLPLAGRYCMGEQSNFILLPMLETALQQINAWQPARIQEYCANLNRPYLEELLTLGFDILPEGQRAHHLVGLRLPEGVVMEKVQADLSAHKILVSVFSTSECGYFGLGISMGHFTVSFEFKVRVDIFREPFKDVVSFSVVSALRLDGDLVFF